MMRIGFAFGFTAERPLLFGAAVFSVIPCAKWKLPIGHLEKDEG
jgi:hypothetical protein